MLFGFFFRKTIDGALSKFRQAVSDLRDVHEREADNANELDREAAQLRLETNAARDESDRAGRIAAKIEAMISGE